MTASSSSLASSISHRSRRRPLVDALILFIAAVIMYISVQGTSELGIRPAFFVELDPTGATRAGPQDHRAQRAGAASGASSTSFSSQSSSPTGFRNGHAPDHNEKPPAPVITNLDNHQLSILLATREPKVKLIKFVYASDLHYLARFYKYHLEGQAQSQRIKSVQSSSGKSQLSSPSSSSSSSPSSPSSTIAQMRRRPHIPAPIVHLGEALQRNGLFRAWLSDAEADTLRSMSANPFAKTTSSSKTASSSSSSSASASSSSSSANRVRGSSSGSTSSSHTTTEAVTATALEENDGVIATVYEASLLTAMAGERGRQAVAMATGYIDKYSIRRHRNQIVVVVTEDWTVLCFDHRLRLRWEHAIPIKIAEDQVLSEVSIFIGAHPMRQGDRGVVVVGGRVVSRDDATAYGMHQERPAGPQGAGAGMEDKETRRAQHRAKTGSEDGTRAADDVPETLFNDGTHFDREQHFSFYAFDAGSGQRRWKHDAGDFHEAVPGAMLLRPQHDTHQGELDWMHFRHDLLKSLPHAWSSKYQTVFELAHFSRKRSGVSAARLQEKATIKSARWAQELGGFVGGSGGPGVASSFFKGNHQQQQQRENAATATAVTRAMAAKRSTSGIRLNHHSESEHVRHPNVIVAHMREGVEVIHLYTGQTVARLALKPGAVHVDVNGDGVIDHIEPVARIDLPGESLGRAEAGAGAGAGAGKGHGPHDGSGATARASGGDGGAHDHARVRSAGSQCIFFVTSGIPPIHQLFNGSVCATKRGGIGAGAQIESTLKAVKGGGAALSALSSAIADVDLRVAPPLPLPHPRPPGGRAVYDVLFFTNAGNIISFSPEGKWQWTTETKASWRSQSIRDALQSSLATEHAEEAFTPSLSHFTVAPVNSPAALRGWEHPKVLAIGKEFVSLLDHDGTILAQVAIPDTPIAPIVIGDFNNDGLNDFIVSTVAGYYGYAVTSNSSAGILSTFFGVLVLVTGILLAYQYYRSMPRRQQVGAAAMGASASKATMMMSATGGALAPVSYIGLYSSMNNPAARGHASSATLQSEAAAAQATGSSTSSTSTSSSSTLNTARSGMLAPGPYRYDPSTLSAVAKDE